MLLSAVSVLVVAQSSSETPEGLMNNPVHYCCLYATSLGTMLLSLGRCSLFPSRVGLRTYHHPYSTNIMSHNLGTTVLNSTANRQTETYRIQAECFQFRVFPCRSGFLNVGKCPLFHSHFWNSLHFARMFYFNTGFIGTDCNV